MVPFIKALSAAASAGVLGYKHRVSAQGRLLAVIWDDRRRKPRLDEFGGMTLNGVHVPIHYVLPVLFAQMKLCAEGGFLQALKGLVNS